MIITLKNFNDLGRYSYATLKETFDTEKDEIFDKDKKVEINSVVDLFPYLWQAPGVSGYSEGKSFAHFNGAGTHWHHDYDNSIKRATKDMEKYQEVERSIIKRFRKDIWAKFVKAVAEYELIKENDNIKLFYKRIL